MIIPKCQICEDTAMDLDGETDTKIYYSCKICGYVKPVPKEGVED